MAIPRTELYVPASAEEIRDDFLVDVRLEARKYADEDQVDRITRPGTDWHILGTTVGNMAMLQYSNIVKAAANTNVLTATGAALDTFRVALGLPPVLATPATGSIVVSLQPTNAFANFSNNEFTLPNGKRGRVNGTFNAVTHNSEVPVITIDTGSDCNLASGELVRFISPPANVEVNAKVSVGDPLTGGTDEEDDERKRDRILNRFRNVPAGGNWSYVVEQCLNALGSVQYAFVYPALGGSASMKVAIVKDIDPDNYDFSRSMSWQALTTVRNALYSVMPDEIEIVVSTPASTTVDAAISVTIPDAISAGGNGQGWINSPPWPNPTASQVVTIDAISADGLQITLNVFTDNSPVAGTQIAWWSSVDQKFYKRVIKTVAGMNGGWILTLDQPLRDHNNAVGTVGEYISPAATYTEEYGQAWRTSMRRLGPGQNTSDANRLPRALRHPFVQDEWYSDLSIQQLLAISQERSEITDIDWLQRSPSTPPVPASVNIAPNILVPRHFGIYKL